MQRRQLKGLIEMDRHWIQHAVPRQKTRNLERYAVITKVSSAHKSVRFLKRHIYFGARMRHRLEKNIAVILAYDKHGNGETKAGTLDLCRIKRGKEFLYVVEVDDRPVIEYFDTNGI